jgi:hypothetical protein
MDENAESLETQTEQTEQTEPQDIRDFVGDQLDKLDKQKAEVETQSETRDEKGRFAPKPVVEEQAPTQETEQPQRNPFSSWKKEAQAALSTLPPEIQKHITERESQFHKGIEQYKELANQGKVFSNAVKPHAEYLQQLGVSPDVAFDKLMQTEKMLRTGTPEQKAVMFQKLAHDYGMNLAALQNIPFDANSHQLQSKIAQLESQLSSFTQSKQIDEEARLNQTIQSFAEGKEYFDDVRETMADLLDKGLARDLEDAYTKAVRLNDDVFSKVSQQTQPVNNQALRADQAAKAAKAAAVSVKGSPSGVTRAPESKSTEDAVRIAMAELGL